MTWIVIVVAMFLVLGPFRRLAFSKSMIALTVPALIGGIFGLIYAYKSNAFSIGISWLPLLLVLFGAGIVGVACKSAADDIFHDKDRR